MRCNGAAVAAVFAKTYQLPPPADRQRSPTFADTNAMFDHPDDPQHLMQSLFALVDTLHGRRPWYGIAAEKLAAVNLPGPLAQLNGTLGNMPGDRENAFPFSTQVHLVPFELLREEG